MIPSSSVSKMENEGDFYHLKLFNKLIFHSKCTLYYLHFSIISSNCSTGSKCHQIRQNIKMDLNCKLFGEQRRKLTLISIKCSGLNKIQKTEVICPNVKFIQPANKVWISSYLRILTFKHKRSDYRSNKNKDDSLSPKFQ